MAVNHHPQTTPTWLKRDAAVGDPRSWDYLAGEDSVTEDLEDTDYQPVATGIPFSEAGDLEDMEDAEDTGDAAWDTEDVVTPADTL